MSDNSSLAKTVPYDLVSGLVVFLVAIPLCLGVALASNAPLFSGLIAGILGGLLVGAISGSQTSVSGPAAGLTGVVASQIESLGTFEAFLTAVVVAGAIQVGLSIIKMGYIAEFFPSSVIKGLLAAIGLVLILKQIPHVFGHDLDPIGNKTFLQADDKNTFSEIIDTFFDIHPGAAFVGILSILILLVWERVPLLKKSLFPAPLVVIMAGVIFNFLFQHAGEYWMIEESHLVQVPEAESVRGFFNLFTFADLTALKTPAVYQAALTIAAVASLETLLNLEAVDKIDPEQRTSPPNRELLAQGIGNIFAGLIGGLPMTSVIVRSSVNVNSGVKTKFSTILHGFFLLVSVALIPSWLNYIPLSALAAILLMTGLKLISPKLIVQMWNEGKNQFAPFIITIIAIVLTDPLIGVLIGLVVAIGFILQSNMRRPISKILEKHSGGNQVLHIELPNQVSFFNRAALDHTLKSVPRGGHVLIDAKHTDYIDPDILDLIIDFKNIVAPAHGVQLSLAGFKDKYPRLEDRIEYIDYSTREAQETLTPNDVLEIFKEGNARFRTGRCLSRDSTRQLNNTSDAQFPLAVILSCIDSRTSSEIVFDLSLGDVFSVRNAGNVVCGKTLGSIEFGCVIAGAKLVLVMGHTSCGAVKSAVSLACSDKSPAEVTGCVSLASLIEEIQSSIDDDITKKFHNFNSKEKENYYKIVSYRNVLRTMRMIQKRSSTLNTLVQEGKVAIVGAMYDITTGEVSLFEDPQ